MKQKIILFLVTIVLPIAAFFSFWSYFLLSPIHTETGYTFNLKQGMGLRSITLELTQKGIIDHPFLFSLYGRLQNNQFKSGEYFFPKGSTPISILQQMTNGVGLAYHHFTIIPGWSFAQLKQAMNKAEDIKHVITIAGMTDKAIMAQMGNADQAPEGQFYPETYYYTRNDADLVILRRAYNLMQTRLTDVWQSRSANLPYKNSYELLTAASLIEKEAHLNTERPIIAGVLINRLHKNMLLQFDPTVIFGMGSKYSGKIHKTDLLTDTIYNTYVHHGLPPTPIAFPSQNSLNAAAKPQNNPYLYFVARGDGSHQFSQTLNEHNAAVASLLKQDAFFNNLPIREHLQDILELDNAVGQIH